MTRDSALTFLTEVAEAIETWEGTMPEGSSAEEVEAARAHMDRLSQAAELVRLLFFAEPGEGWQMKVNKETKQIEQIVRIVQPPKSLLIS